MKIKNYILLCSVLLAGFTSCSENENVNGQTEAERDMYIKIGKAATKADTEEVAGGTPIEFTEGALFFTNTNGDIFRYIRITNNSIAGTLTATQLTEGTVIQKVHQNATVVHVYGNFETDKTYQNISEIESTTYKNQLDENYGVANARLYGSGTVSQLSGTSSTGVDYEYTAEVNVAAIMARLEIDKITATGAITSYTLAGIYINNFYINVLPNGDIIPNATEKEDKLINYLQAYEKYYRANITSYPDGNNRPNAINGQFDVDMKYYLYDDKYPAGALGKSDLAKNGVLEPENDVWAYNVFATGTATPHIVLHFIDLMVDNGAGTNTSELIPNHTTLVAGEAYLTITGYIDTDANNGFVDILGGYIYKMENVIFDEDDLGEVPEKNEKKDILVKVSLLPWTVKKVNPSFE